MRVEYRSNNSGGNWWLSDEDWRALEAAGWAVKWIANSTSTYRKPDAEGRWLGALACEASREGLSMREAVTEWERVTGQSSTDGGCPCCGQPHYFTEYDDAGDYVSSGPDISYEASW